MRDIIHNVMQYKNMISLVLGEMQLFHEFNTNTLCYSTDRIAFSVSHQGKNMSIQTGNLGLQNLKDERTHKNI